MPIKVTCSSCNATLRGPDAAAGKKIKCPKCGAATRVPAALASASTTAALAHASDSGKSIPQPETLLHEADGPQQQPTIGPPLPDTIPGSPASEGDGSLPRMPGYELLAVLGRGGMGVVYKARHVGLNRIVALKMILSGAHAGKNGLDRFRTEAQAIARVKHANIVQVYEFGEHDGLPFIALEFVSGGSLDSKLQGSPFSPAEGAKLVEMLARGIHKAHQSGVIHRDLKPANVLLDEDDTPKITDFGLAKKLDEAGQTASGMVMGTPSYMAPEQAEGRVKELGPAVDIYALGAILYECLTGRPPFKAATAVATVMQAIRDEPVPPMTLNDEVPEALQAICLKCLQKQPAKRYRTAAALADELSRFQGGEPTVTLPKARRKSARTVALVASAIAGLALAACAVVGIVLMVGKGSVAQEKPGENPEEAKIQKPDKQKEPALAKTDVANAKQAALLVKQGATLLNKRQWETAIPILREAVRLDPTSDRAHKHLGCALQQNWQTDEAIAELRTALELNSSHGDTPVELALCLCRKGELEEAVKWARYPKARSWYETTCLGRVLAEVGQLDEAIVICREAVRLAPTNALTHRNLGFGLEKKGLLDEAIAAYRVAVAREGNAPFQVGALAAALAKGGQTGEAVAMLKRVIAANPSEYELLNAQIHLGKTLAKTGQLDQCSEIYREVLRSKPLDDFHHSGMAWALATSPDPAQRNLKAAVDHAKKATEMNVVNGDAWSVLGVVQYRTGDWKAATEAFKQSLKLRNGGDSIDWFFLAMAHWQLGDKETARTWYDKAVQSIDQNSPNDVELQGFRAEAATLLEMKDK